LRYSIRHSFDIDSDTFWNKLFFEHEYNQALFVGHLKFPVYRVQEFKRASDGSVHRRIECAPPVEVPAVARKIVGDTASYIEDGRFEPNTRRFKLEITPKLGADKIKTSVTLWVEPRGNKRIERIAEIDNSVAVFGVGKLVEAFIEKQTRATYDASAAFTRQWIVQKGL
jgi:hypothetical protein